MKKIYLISGMILFFLVIFVFKNINVKPENVAKQTFTQLIYSDQKKEIDEIYKILKKTPYNKRRDFEQEWEIMKENKNIYFWSNYAMAITYEFNRKKDQYVIWFFSKTDKKFELKKFERGNFILSLSSAKASYNKSGYIKIFSKYPFMAKERSSYFSFDKNGLEFLQTKTIDSTKDYYKKVNKLLKQGKFKEVMQIDEKPKFYKNYKEDYLKTAKLCIRSADAYSISEFNKGHINEATSVLKYGINEYLMAQIDTPLDLQYADFLDKLLKDPENLEVSHRISAREFAKILNNYAYFLMNKRMYSDARTILLKVKDIDANRTVNYGNLGDVHWNLKKYKEAIDYYKKYVELMGGVENPKIPEKIKIRIYLDPNNIPIEYLKEN